MVTKIVKNTQIKKVTEETDNQYYDEDDKMDIASLIKKVEKKMNQM